MSKPEWQKKPTSSDNPLRRLERKILGMSDKAENRLLNGGLIGTVLGIGCISYFGTDRQMISPRMNDILTLSIFSLSFVILGIVYVRAKKEERAKYRFLAVMGLLFLIVKYMFF